MDDETLPDYPDLDIPNQETVVPLGYSRGPIFYYYSTSLRQTAELKPAEHTRANLAGLASGPKYWESFEQFQTKKGLSYAQLSDWLMAQCRAKGVYDPNLIRGRGAWMESGQPIFHAGDALVINGERASLTYPGSRFIYEADAALIPDILPPASDEDAQWLPRVCKLLRWETPAHGTLLAGWIAIAPISGALRWRSSVWLTGGSGAGKSWVMDKIVHAVLGQIAVAAASTTSEPGIRQKLQSDARPVIFDEAEAETAKAAETLQSVLNLVRVSASENAPEILKGQISQARAKSFRIRSCFMFQSINVALSKRADESRITVLSLRDHSTATDINFADLETTVRERITPELGAALIARSVALIPVIRANAETFATAIATHLKSRRLGDQLGTLLAGAYSLHSSGRITPANALKYVQAEQWVEQAQPDDEKDEYRLLRHLMAAKLKIGTADMPVSRLVEAVHAAEQIPGLPAQETASRALCEAGIKYAAHENVMGLFFSTNHPALKQLLRGTDWTASWSRALARIPGSASGRDIQARFGVGHKSKATWLPMSVIDPAE